MKIKGCLACVFRVNVTESHRVLWLDTVILLYVLVLTDHSGVTYGEFVLWGQVSCCGCTKLDRWWLIHPWMECNHTLAGWVLRGACALWDRADWVDLELLCQSVRWSPDVTWVMWRTVCSSNWEEDAGDRLCELELDSGSLSCQQGGGQRWRQPWRRESWKLAH